MEDIFYAKEAEREITMNCKVCGNELKSTDCFCTMCGTPVEIQKDVGETEQKVEANETNEKAATKEEKAIERKKCKWILPVVITSGVLIACITILIPVLAIAKSNNKQNDIQREYSNRESSGFYTVDDKNLYFLENGRVYKKNLKNGTIEILFTYDKNQYPQSLFMNEGELYLRCGEVIYQIPKKGSQVSKETYYLHDRSSSCVLGNNKLYEYTYYGEVRISSIRNGKASGTTVTSFPADIYYIQPYKNHVYVGSTSGIYRSDKDMGNVELLYSGDVETFIIYKNSLYFIDHYDSCMYSMDLDGKNLHSLGIYCWDFNIIDDRIYYESEGEILSSKLNGTDTKVLVVDETASSFVVTENAIYYMSYNNGTYSDNYDNEFWTINRMNLNGSNMEVIYRGED